MILRMQTLERGEVGRRKVKRRAGEEEERARWAGTGRKFTNSPVLGDGRVPAGLSAGSAIALSLLLPGNRPVSSSRRSRRVEMAEYQLLAVLGE